MESQPQNSEFRKNPENFHLCKEYIEDLTWVLMFY